MATPIQALFFYLATAIDATQTTIPVRGLKDSRGNSITAMPSGATLIYATIEPRSSANQEIISFTGITDNGNGLVTLTGVTRNINPQPPFDTLAGVVPHGNNAEIVLSNSPSFYNVFTQTDKVAVITVQWQFPTPTAPFSPATKAYVDAIVLAGALDAGTGQKGISKLTYPALKSLGVTTITIASPAVITSTAHGLIAGDTIRFSTTGSLPTGLSAGVDYYVIATGLTANDFQIALIAGGTAINTSGSQSGVHTLIKTTPTVVTNTDPAYGANNHASATGLVDAFIVDLPTTPTAYVKGQVYSFIANLANTSTAPTVNISSLGAKTIKKLNGSALVAGDIGAGMVVYVLYNGTDMIMLNPVATPPTVYALKSENYTANGAIAQNASVYPDSATKVKVIYPSDMGTPTTIATSATSVRATKSLPLSTAGMFLHIVGGDWRLSGALVAQVRTMNAGETDFSNGTEAIIYNTSNGVRGYDVVSIGTDKFLLIFQADTGGAPAGIKAVVITVSGTSITVGSVVTLETTGAIGRMYSVSKLDTDKCLALYQKDSDGDFYAQVLTVSGTVISTNTAYLIKAISGNGYIYSDQLATDSVLCIYSETSTGTVIYGRTLSVSGTVVTVNAENTLVTTGGAGAGGWGMSVRVMSPTRAVFACSENYAPTNDRIFGIAISGTTLTASASLAYNTGHYTSWYGMAVINSDLVLISQYAGNTSIDIWLVTLASGTPVKITNKAYGFSTTSNQYQGCALVKVAPWTYVSDAFSNDADYIFKLTPATTARIGIAQSAIADTASGTILYRYQVQTLSGTTLTVGATYYVDDNGQLTSKSSVTALTLGTVGVAITTSKILLQ